MCIRDRTREQAVTLLCNYAEAQGLDVSAAADLSGYPDALSLIHISEPTRRTPISDAVFCLKKFFFNDTATTEIYTV